MGVVACCKWVADKQAGTPNASSLRLGLDDRNAIEAARILADAQGTDVIVLSCIESDSSWIAREALTRGASKLAWYPLPTGRSNDTRLVSACLCSAISSWKDVTAVVCADGSEDRMGREVPARIAARLDWPLITRVVQFSFDTDSVTAIRQCERCRELVFTPFPLVMSVLPEAAPAQIPSVLQIISAANKPVQELPVPAELTDVPNPISEKRLPARNENRKQLILDASDPTSIGRFAAYLRQEGVLAV